MKANQAQLFRECREDKYQTQAEFAKTLGVSTVLVAMIESGQKPISRQMLKKLYKLGFKNATWEMFKAQMEEL